MVRLKADTTDVRSMVRLKADTTDLIFVHHFESHFDQ
jgi:hypothetical protein